MLGICRAFSISSTATKEAIVGAAKLGAFLGTFLGALVMLRYGRRPAIASQAAFFVAGPLAMAAATGPGWVRVQGVGTCADGSSNGAWWVRV